MKKQSLIDRARHNAWIFSGISLLILLILIFFQYKNTLLAMTEIWRRSETFTHCFLVLPISLWLVWKKRDELLALSPSPNFWGLIPFIIFGFLWLLGSITATNSVSQFSVIGLMISGTFLVLGFPVVRVITFPLGFLFFAVPVGEFLLPILMEWTANFTIYALRLTGIPVYRDGLQFVIPSGNWSVVEACSGVRYLIASLTVGTLFSYLNYTSNKRRFIFVAISIIVPIFANWLRAYMIVMLGHFSGNTIAVGVDHIIYGWLFFGIVVISMFMIGIRWAEFPSSDLKQKVIFTNSAVKNKKFSPILCGLIVGVIFCFMPIVFFEKINLIQNLGQVHLTAPLAFKDDWVSVKDSADTWKPSYEKFASEISNTYEKNHEKVGLYIAYYRNQNFDSKMISSANVLVRSEDPLWNTVYRGREEVKLKENSIKIRSSTLSHINTVAGIRDQQMEVWYFYWIEGRVTDSDYLAKIFTGFSKLFGKGDDAAIVVLHVARERGVDSGAVLTHFLQDNYSQIDELLHTTRTEKGVAVTTIWK